MMPLTTCEFDELTLILEEKEISSVEPLIERGLIVPCIPEESPKYRLTRKGLELYLEMFEPTAEQYMLLSTMNTYRTHIENYGYSDMNFLHKLGLLYGTPDNKRYGISQKGQKFLNSYQRRRCLFPNVVNNQPVEHLVVDRNVAPKSFTEYCKSELNLNWDKEVQILKALYDSGAVASSAFDSERIQKLIGMGLIEESVSGRLQLTYRGYIFYTNIAEDLEPLETRSEIVHLRRRKPPTEGTWVSWDSGICRRLRTETSTHCTLISTDGKFIFHHVPEIEVKNLPEFGEIELLALEECFAKLDALQDPQYSFEFSEFPYTLFYFLVEHNLIVLEDYFKVRFTPTMYRYGRALLYSKEIS